MFSDVLKFIFALSTLLWSIGYAGPGRDLERQINQIRTLKANFVQTVYRPNGQLVQRSSGQVQIHRPGRFRWDIHKPTPQVIVADGQRLWEYDKNLKQVTISPLSKMEGSAAIFLSRSIDGLARQYHIKVTGNHYQLYVKQGKGEFHRLSVVIQGTQLQSITVIDQLGNKATIRFNALQVNVPIAGGVFEFRPPRGADVISWRQ